MLSTPLCLVNALLNWTSCNLFGDELSVPATADNLRMAGLTHKLYDKNAVLSIRNQLISIAQCESVGPQVSLVRLRFEGVRGVVWQCRRLSFTQPSTHCSGSYRLAPETKLMHLSQRCEHIASLVSLIIYTLSHLIHDRMPAVSACGVKVMDNARMVCKVCEGTSNAKY